LGRCKKTFESALKRLKTGKNLAWIAHLEQPLLQRTIFIVRCTIASLGDGVKTFSESDPDAMALGHYRTWRARSGMSALPPKRDIDHDDAAKRYLFDHLVGTHK